MSAEAVVPSEEELAVAYETLTWIGDGISFWTEKHKCIRLKYDDNNIRFLTKEHRKYNYNTLIKDMTCKTQNIYIEWVQSTGKYLYYNLLSIAKHVKKVKFPLSVFEYKKNSKHCIKPSFDESVSLDKILSTNDIILLSPIRSFELKYTVMGQHYNHTLYLGPLPSKQFVKQCHIKYLFNCCSYTNDDDIIQLPGVKEILFDVAGWTVGRVDDDESDESDDEKNNDQDDGKKDTYDDGLKYNDMQSLMQLQLAYLDKKIDLVDKTLKEGNVLIHCLAGAHRSPFITGCYEYKYGKLNGKTPKEIYKWLTSTRDIVQTLGYDKFMNDYFAFLKKNQK